MTRRVSRRTVLKGLGIAFALPWLESALWADEPKKGRKGKPPVRAAFLFIPNGAHKPAWELPPGGKGLSPTLEPLKPHLAELIVTSMLRLDKANANGDGAGDHARSAGSYLTGVQCRKTSGADIQAGVSIDQLIASRIGHLTPLPSIELGMEQGGSAGNCDSGYSCAYSSNISWRTPSTPMAKEVNPKHVFKRMFLDMQQPASDQAAGQAVSLKKSILDLVMEDAKSLRSDLGGGDQKKLDEYLDSVRALETRIQNASSRTAPEGGDHVPDLKLPDSPPKDYTERIQLMFDLIALGFQADITRVVTFMYGNGGSGLTYPFLGVSGGHHELTHHGGDQAKIDAVKKIDRYHMEQFGYLLDKLKGIKEGDGTLLDNCILLSGCGLGDGNRHNHDDLPVILAGRGGGALAPAGR